MHTSSALQTTVLFVSIMTPSASRINSRMRNVLNASGSFTADKQNLKENVGKISDLKIHAVTFNAGNSKFTKPSDDDGFYKTVLAGHEESDIVILGLQEIYEEGDVMQDWLQQKVLWKDGTAEVLDDFRRQVAALAKPPAEILEAQEVMRSKFKVFHSDLGAATDKFIQKYGSGEAGNDFRAHISEVSALSHLGETSQKEVQSIEKETKTVLDHYVQRKADGITQKFPQLDADLSSLGTTSIDQPDIAGERQTIKRWAEETQLKIEQARHTLPNLHFTPAGEKQWRDFVRMVDNELLIQRELQKAAKQHENFKEALTYYGKVTK